MKFLISILLCLAVFKNTVAQTKFTEGKIVYDVYVNNVTDSAQGVLTVTLRQWQMKRELSMKNGYKNTIIFNAKLNKTTSFSQINSKKIAKLLSQIELEKNNLLFENATYEPDTNSKIIAGFTTQKTTVRYTNGNTNTVYFTSDYEPLLKEYNAMFNQIKGLPLQYEVHAGTNKMTMIAKSVSVEPVGNNAFEALKGYEMLKN